MQKLITFIVAAIACLFMPAKSIAQKCDLDIDKVDAFSNERTRSATNPVGEKRNRWKLILTRTNNKYTWSLYIVYGVVVDKTIKKGETVKLKLENGKILELVIDADYLPTAGVDGPKVYTAFLPKGELTEANIKDLSESPITNLQTNVLGYSPQIEITSKQGEAIQETAKCLLKP